MEGAAAEEGGAAVATLPPHPTCPVCMEPWTCNGDHRICCIPCGHVYGRSCLERWLHRSAHGSANCPQCGEQFEHKLIINLYAPGNLWDGCCRLQDYKSTVGSMIARFRVEMDELIANKVDAAFTKCYHAYGEKMVMANANMMSMKNQMKKMVDKENATTTDLIEFMERSFPQLSPISENSKGV